MYIMRIGIVFTLMALGIHPAWPAGVTVRGVFPGAEGEEIRVMKARDLISNSLTEIASDIIDQEGSFFIRIAIDEPLQLTLRIMHASNHFYAEPGNDLHIVFEPMGHDNQMQRNIQHSLRGGFSMDIHNRREDQIDLNLKVALLHEMVADYIEMQVAPNIRASHRTSLGLFANRLQETFADCNHPFLEDYITYYVAYLERSLNTKAFNSLFKEYISGQSLRYGHPMYMDFFRAMFDNYLFSESRSIDIRDLYAAVNRQGSYVALMDTLGKDSLLFNDRLRELVMLNGLQRMFARDDFRAAQVREVLQQAISGSHFPYHVAIAENILDRRLSLHPGSEAPPMELYDTAGAKVSLQDFSGKYVYVFFGAGWCNTTMAELGPLADIAGSFSEDVAVLGILTDRDKSFIEPMLAPGIFPFRLLHFGNDYRLLDNYRILTIPQFLLIDPDGRMAAYPFVSPSAGAAERLRQIIEK